jgi:hypothetical protein
VVAVVEDPILVQLPMSLAAAAELEDIELELFL